MSEPFLAQISLFAFTFAPRGWADCDGQILPINQNMSLYSLLGTTYGGDGRSTFALPDLRGRLALHLDGTQQLGRRGGEERHTLTIAELPTHTHTLRAVDAPATSAAPVTADSPPVPLALARSGGAQLYGSPGDGGTLASAALSSTGGGQAHENMQPFLTIRACIALQGIFPSRN